MKDLIDVDFHDRVEILMDDDSLFVGDIVAMSSGFYQENTPPYNYYSEFDARIKIREGDTKFWTTQSKVTKVIMTAKETLSIESSYEGINGI